MMLKIMIIRLASDNEGTTFKLHSHEQPLARFVARNLQLGGCFGNVSYTETVYTWNWNVFLIKVRCGPKKKDFRPRWDQVLRPNFLQVQPQSSHVLIASDNGWAIFAFRAKVGFKNNKNRALCLLCTPVGSQTHLPRRPWQRYCFNCENRHFSF